MMAPNYDVLFKSVVLRALTGPDLSAIIRFMLFQHRIYRELEEKTGVPWAVIASIHYRECSLSLARHLHNGDSLVARTIHAPPGRPIAGHPPFTFQESAIDALSNRWKPKTWDIPGMLEFMERYNGLGYQAEGINSPYLWSWTNQYNTGLFVADGKFDPKKRCGQAGCAAILKSLQSRGVALKSETMLH